MKSTHMFVVAGVQTSLPYFIKELPEDKLHKFLEIVCSKGLVSFGAPLNKKTKDKPVKKEQHFKHICKLLETYPKVSKALDMFIDSGGFQVTMGYIHKKHIPLFIELYTEFLSKFKNLYDYAFSLDIPVLPGNPTNEELLKLNIESYNLIDNLPKEIQDRLYFVSHFRLKFLYEIWNSLIFEEQLIKKYKKFSIGGLVASQPAAKKMYFNLYTFGILQVLLGLEYKLPNPFYFHILGSATSTNIIYFTLLEKLISDLFNVETYVTFDSSAVFTKVQQARTFTYFDEKNMYCINVDLRYDFLKNKVHHLNKTNLELTWNVIKDICNFSGLDIPPSEELYESKDGTFKQEIRPFILALESYSLNKIADFCREYSQELYDLYKNDELKFTMELENLFTRFNGGKISHTSVPKVSSIKLSLDTIRDFCLNKKSFSELKNMFDSISHILDSEETKDYTNNFNLWS